MRPRGGAFEPHDEIDAIRWLPLDEALRTISYERDHPVLGAVRPGLFR